MGCMTPSGTPTQGSSAASRLLKSSSALRGFSGSGPDDIRLVDLDEEEAAEREVTSAFYNSSDEFSSLSG